MRHLALLCLGLSCAFAGAAEVPAALRHRAAIDAPAGDSHYRLRLTGDVYAGLERRDLGDLRVLNAQGEPVPYAFVPREPASPTPVLTAAAKLFPLYGNESQEIDGVKIDVVRGAGGTVIRLAEPGKAHKKLRNLLGYLVDIGRDAKPVQALSLDWRTARGFDGTVRVEASEDLSHWRTLARDAPILELEHAGERLERRRVELRGSTARFLRISFAHVPEDFRLRSVQLERQGEHAEAQRDWKRLAAVEAAPAGEYRFSAGGRFPVDRVRLQLPQRNTVARLQLLSRDRDDEPWRLRASATAYRLERDGRSVTSPDVGMAPTADRQWLVRVDPRGGGVGAGGLALELGWIPHEVVFAARGEAPFVLAFGDSRARPEALAIALVVPGYQADKPIEARKASLGAVALSPQANFLSDPAGWFRHAMAAGSGRTWILWLVLCAGVLAVAWMALRLLREVGAGKR
jgi:hypothetical protein